MDEQDLTGDVEGAWTAFRVRLADRLDGLLGGDAVVVEVQTGVAEDELEGCVPTLGFSLLDDGRLLAEVLGNNDLDARFWMGTDETVRMSWSWEYPNDESDHWHQGVDVRDVDRLVADCVEVLREVHGVLHPSFLLAEGLEHDPADQVPVEAAERSGPLGADDVALAHSRDELVALVDEALLEVCEGSVEHDDDGDVPFPVGMSVLFVRVMDERPSVELFAELVVEPGRPERLPVELDILNRTHPLAKFYVSGTGIRMSHELVAWPFSPRQLRVVLARMLDDLDTIAESLALRVEGRRFLEAPEAEASAESAASAAPPRPAGPAFAAHAGMTTLLELLHLGPVSSPAVAELFGHDRALITRHCTAIRLGLVECDEHDEEQVLTSLRRALRHVVNGEVPERRRRPLPPRRRTEQGLLLDDDEAGGDNTLDLGWSA